MMPFRVLRGCCSKSSANDVVVSGGGRPPKRSYSYAFDHESDGKLFAAEKDTYLTSFQYM